MNYSRQRAKIGEKEESAIAGYVLQHPNMTRTNLAELIQKEVNWLDKPPEIEVLERKISAYRQSHPGNPQDKPWSLSTLDDFPISSWDLPAVLWWFHRQKTERDRVLTIREAKWIARLHRVDLEGNENDLRVILADRFGSVGAGNALIIAKAEQISEVIGQPFDGKDFDILLSKGKVQNPGGVMMAASLSEAGMSIKDSTNPKRKKPIKNPSLSKNQGKVNNESESN